MKVTVSIRPDPPLHVSASCQERHDPLQGAAVAGKKNPTTFLRLLLQIPQAISRESATSLKPLTHSLKRFTSLLTLFLITSTRTYLQTILSFRLHHSSVCFCWGCICRAQVSSMTAPNPIKTPSSQQRKGTCPSTEIMPSKRNSFSSA